MKNGEGDLDENQKSGETERRQNEQANRCPRRDVEPCGLANDPMGTVVKRSLHKSLLKQSTTTVPADPPK